MKQHATGVSKDAQVFANCSIIDIELVDGVVVLGEDLGAFRAALN